MAFHEFYLRMKISSKVHSDIFTYQGNIEFVHHSLCYYLLNPKNKITIILDPQINLVKLPSAQEPPVPKFEQHLLGCTEFSLMLYSTFPESSNFLRIFPQTRPTL